MHAALSGLKCVLPLSITRHNVQNRYPVNMQDPIRKHSGYGQLWPLRPACSQNRPGLYMADPTSRIRFSSVFPPWSERGTNPTETEIILCIYTKHRFFFVFCLVSLFICFVLSRCVKENNNNNKNVLCIIICIIVNNIDVPCNLQALTVNARIILQ